MKIRNVLLSMVFLALIALNMGFVGKSGSGLTVVTPGGSGGGACSQGGSQIAQCPSGTLVVGGACNFVQGESAIEEFNYVFLADQSVFCTYTCTDEGMNDEVLVQVSAVCATTN